jgi:hypothetical protein
MVMNIFGNTGFSDMQILTYRIMIALRKLVLITGASAMIISCEKELKTDPPLISLSDGSGYISHDTVIPAGQKMRIGINAAATDANLTYFSVRFNDGSQTTLLDSGMNTHSIFYTLDVIKTNAPVEIWTFVVMDRNRVQDSIRIVFTKSEIPAWGAINTLIGFTLGAQENQETGSFFSIAGNWVMNQQQAYENQVLVDMIYYYGQYEGTLASPNEAEAPGFFTGTQGIANWSVKNETRYDTTMITPQSFDNALNDSLILTAYEPTAGKKKAKFVEPGMVISFKSPAGKLGLIKIQDIIPGPSGSVTFSMKIQN